MHFCIYILYEKEIKHFFSIVSFTFHNFILNSINRFHENKTNVFTPVNDNWLLSFTIDISFFSAWNSNINFRPNFSFTRTVKKSFQLIWGTKIRLYFILFEVSLICWFSSHFQITLDVLFVLAKRHKCTPSCINNISIESKIKSNHLSNFPHFQWNFVNSTNYQKKKK